MNEIKNLEGLFKNSTYLRVPAYQRAYAWEQKQLEQFVSDIIEITDKEYYYGHFILEKVGSDFEIIDGQQRITTFVLFLMVSRKLTNKTEWNDIINCFSTVDYDDALFKALKENTPPNCKEWGLECPENTNLTLSIQKILFALNYLEKVFLDKIETLDTYINTFLKAHISTHITESKAVAVQIFELQNTRGIELNLIERVKAKLMKTVFLFDNAENNINTIQNHFARIYELEESIQDSSFRGDMSLDYLLLHHLRIIDDGSKLTTDNINELATPSKTGKHEHLIINYLNTKIKESFNPVTYILNLIEKFCETVEFVSNQLPILDTNNRLIGDVIILDKSLSLEFLLLLHFKKLDGKLADKKFMTLWEKLLFMRDFHDRFYMKTYRANFEKFFHLISKSDQEEEILKHFVLEGFRKELMDDENLPLTVKKYVDGKKNVFLTNSFNFLKEKVKYTLYKYEINIGADLLELRKIIKNGASVEHMLPVGFDINWFKDKTSKSNQEFKKEIEEVINGFGNLLLITPSENSSESNDHPMDKEYKSCFGGSYSLHNKGKLVWEDPNNWIKIINDRGESIYKFLVEEMISFN
jgi:hypothetical protein